MKTRKAVGAIVTHKNRFLIVRKVTINTRMGKELQNGIWDFVKGRVEDEDETVEASMRRELLEETGSVAYTLKKRFNETISFAFPEKIQTKIGYHNQITTMFHFEYVGDGKDLEANDKEINQICFVHEQALLSLLEHEESKEFFTRNRSQIISKK
ncbi:NUDIX domain-containing protein [Bacillus hwajinpoensis]|uniref:NUDIX domain-containing protein n=1 Tax=Guptibacillus hwajinpoensis TaxID=208199 RepID=A0A845EXF7_9BACL|nr:NUDIX domain-containing protein [Pseudalkalibacillus hwajinpoensis]MYL63241.1 NUDIX domain-containing protein [Pseudalkalibacillus hwajinpoensis]